MAVIATQDASAGLDSVAFTAAAAGDQVTSGTSVGGWDLAVVLLVRNASVATRDVTVEGTLFTIPVSGQAAIPVRGNAAFGDLVDVTYSTVADLTRAVLGFARGLK